MRAWRRGVGDIAVEAQAAAGAVAGEARLAVRARPDGPAGGLVRAVLRVRRSAVLPFRRRAGGRSRRGAAPASRGCRRFIRRALPRPSGGPPKRRTSISDLQFTDAYRVPFQYSRMVRRHLPAAAFLQSSAGVMVNDLDGNGFYDVTGSYGVNLFGYDFYKARIARGAGAGPRARPGARPLPSGDRRQREAPEGDFRPRRSVLSHVRDRGRDAGGPAGALSHAAVAPGAVLRRLSRLVGRRAAGRRQSASRARDLYAEAKCPTIRCGSCALAATSPACWSIRCRRCIPMRAAPCRFVAGRQRAHARISTGKPTRTGSSACGRSAPNRTSS